MGTNGQPTVGTNLSFTKFLFVIAYQDLLFFGTLPSLSDTFLMLAYAFASLALGFTVFDRLRDVLAEAL